MNSIDPGTSGPSETTGETAGETTGQNGPGRSIVLVGLMGAGKTCIGRRLASRLARPFVDADAEIEKAAGCTIEDIFESHGEAAFRDGERRVIARILDGPPVVLATGGGAYMNEETRAKIRQHGISVWIRAELDLLLKRTSRRNNRPLLKRGDRRQIMGALMAERYPVYAEADLTVDSKDGPPDETVEAVLRALNERPEDQPNAQQADPVGIAQ